MREWKNHSDGTHADYVVGTRNTVVPLKPEKSYHILKEGLYMVRKNIAWHLNEM